MKAREKRRKRAARAARRSPMARYLRAERLGMKRMMRQRLAAYAYAEPKVRAKAIHAVTPRMP